MIPIFIPQYSMVSIVLKFSTPSFGMRLMFLTSHTKILTSHAVWKRLHVKSRMGNLMSNKTDM